MIGAVVVSYHSTADLKKFLWSFIEHGSGNELVVSLVEATPQEEAATREMLDQMHSIETYLQVHPTNVGYGFACNAGALTWYYHHEVTTHAFFNADTELRAGVLQSCEDLLISDPTFGVVGPKQVDQSRLVTHAGITGPPPRHRAFRVHAAENEYTDILTDCWSVMGSAYFTPADIWWELTECPLFKQVQPRAKGAFLETEHFFEDEWYSRHAVAHGYKVVYNGQATMIHKQGGATPVGPWAHTAMRKARPLYEEACRVHGIASA